MLHGVDAGLPPAEHAYLQYGVAFAAEYVASPGPVCARDTDPCILGSGGGIAARVGWRPAREWYAGGAYELTKQDPNKLYRLALLHQLRVEGRRYFTTARETQPFVVLGVGVAGYGNEWSIDTWGPGAAIGAGLELNVAGGTLVSVAVAYRPTYLHAWVDSSTLSHDAGIAHMVSFELMLEAQDRL